MLVDVGVAVIVVVAVPVGEGLVLLQALQLVVPGRRHFFPSRFLRAAT